MKSLIRKYLSGRSTRDEQKQLLDCIREEGGLSEFHVEKSRWEKEAINGEMPLFSRQSWGALQKELFLYTQNKLERTTIRMHYFRYAAAVLILVSISLVTLYIVNIHSNNSLVYTTVKAEQGQLANVILPDRTEVWLNSGSYIKYNNRFSSTNRDVELVGEAYFNVVKNKDLPLIVKGAPIQVKVLGTKFNVTAYPDDHYFSVALEEGKVELFSSQFDGFSRHLIPGQLAVFNEETHELKIRHTNVGLYTSWKDGIINIYNLPLEEVIVKLSKRYNQKFEIDDKVKSIRYTYTIKNEPLSEVLKLMETITPINAVQEGDIIKLKYNERKMK
jgi:transmembrane sensor